MALRKDEMQVKKSDKLTMQNRCLKINGEPFVVDYPDEQLFDVDDNKLVTIFRGHLYNYWNPEDISGYFA